MTRREFRDRTHNSFLLALGNPVIKTLWIVLYIVIVLAITASVYMMPQEPVIQTDTLGEQIRKLQELNSYGCD